ncbi:hypothetical protein [Terracidiphilus sp.]|jgi:hypothetical protein|uniref:hypothetical protein n=1 Tax=Terracidiphilus sp. TaxID=1964191 RepID=UPI003C15F49B
MKSRWTQLTLIWGIILVPLGCFQFFFAWQFSDAAKREIASVGKIVHAYHGRGTSYLYVFTVDGVNYQDDSGTCVTPISRLGCKEGAPVLVYYDREHLSLSRMQEFQAASREKLFGGEWATGIGLLLLGLHFWIGRNRSDSEDSEESDDADADKPDKESEVLHIAPGR